MGTSVDLNIAWLTPAQLQIMHQTESLGIAYDWVEWDLSVIEHRFNAPLDQLFRLCGADRRDERCR